ncbi:hypothetical protein [Neolewinella persica]|uniref:hypothetical protein n=1 Tax=Neolewinella persica TaxID=70998 RepID=UPI00037E2DFC|nr:hypothetical protein [Neolewinella persica]
MLTISIRDLTFNAGVVATQAIKHLAPLNDGLYQRPFKPKTKAFGSVVIDASGFEWMFSGLD